MTCKSKTQGLNFVVGNPREKVISHAAWTTVQPGDFFGLCLDSMVKISHLKTVKKEKKKGTFHNLEYKISFKK